MPIFESIDITTSIIFIIIWASVFLVGTVGFIVVTYYAKRFFSSRAILEIYKDEKGRITKRINYRRVDKEVVVSSLKLKRKHPSYMVSSIRSDSDIKQGTIASFIMPRGDVTIVYEIEGQKNKVTDEEEKNIKKAILPVSKDIYEEGKIEARPILLLSTDDLIQHIEASNSQFDKYPLYNSFRYSYSDQREVMVNYVGEAIYSVVICSEAVFKCLFRSDSGFVKDNIKDIDTLVFLQDDIYSIVLDSSFKSLKRFFEIIDHSYQYTLLTSYEYNEDVYKLKAELTSASNSLILSYNEKISLEFDPVYDKAIEEARKYRAKLLVIKKKEEELDKDFITPKEEVYKELDKVDMDYQNAMLDKYAIPLYEIHDGPYVEKKEKVYVPKVRPVPTIEEKLKDMPVVVPSVLKINNFIDYVMTRKDMVSLTIDVSTSYKKKPTCMKYLTDKYFALIYKGRKCYVFNFKFDLDYVKKLKRKHPKISHVRNGVEEDWYMVLLDNTFTSYEELYDIAFASYTYTKELYYKSIAKAEKK